MVTLGNISAISQSSVLLPQVQFQASIRGRPFLPRNVTYAGAYTDCTSVCFLKTRSYKQSHTVSALNQQEKRATWAINASVIPESKVQTSSTVNSASEGVGIEPDTTGGGGDIGGASGGGDSGGGGNNWGNNNEGDGESEQSGDSNKKMAMSMSQKLTLGYAALVGLGGLMGYVKSGSQKSIISGGISAAILLFVYSQLPTNPVFASSVGFGMSAALLGVMGSRFKNSGKIFPAGVVSLVSFVMTGGYLHGIMRGMH
ncbi:hypothetical protein DCAR_0418239 [Daucus carota subsp. sativus]|uniref:Uncharacterized protein n=1 Tax=Daucus carota subsp. sativus TaxID=79200 RepID=A0A165Z9C2_DAUCS|nr:PREDICTED: protein FATTY ACID EXPORT 2, chloroplastic-like [Daucus carota subsp. sativus]WOG98893.1 hypothetical protein DCAR_0418239 [Daucus carota subsp. sativus]